MEEVVNTDVQNTQPRVTLPYSRLRRVAAKLQEQQQQQQQQQSKPQEQAATQQQEQEEKPTSAQEVNWEERAKQHQSRADKLYEQLKQKEKELEGKRIINEEEYAKLVDAYNKVEAFTKDPISFMHTYLPDIAAQLSNVGDPIKLVEQEVLKFRKQLDEAFKKEFGDNWRYNPAEADDPSSPHFRYRLAVADKVDEVRSKYRRTVEEYNEKLRAIERQKQEDIKRLKNEYGFTDEDIERANQRLANTQISYYDLVRLALLDDIVKLKLNVHSPITVPKDITTVRSDVEPAPKKTKLSDDAKLIISRLGRKAILTH
ncbi:MAG: hypothetical protein QW194_04225 [Candidatus Micrarchaeaceae archaeon]